jgi:MFS family permease
MELAHVAPASGESGDRPVAELPKTQLVRLSLYWLGLSSIFIGVSQILSGRIQFEEGGPLYSPGSEGTTLFALTVAGALIAALVQPTVGSISDYTISRWGRRKPYIFIGSVLDVVFLYGVATSNSILAVASFMVLLQVSANFAQGPFQGYVPDLVPVKQVGLASALVGLFQVLGNAVGFGIGSAAVATDNFFLGMMALGALELATMVSVVWRVNEGRTARDRGGRSWLSVAREAWATDILKERSFLWLVTSRLFFLMGATMLINLSLFYFAQTFGLDQEAAGGANFPVLAAVIFGNIVTVIPAGRISDRVGRKPVIYVACAVAGTGMLIVALAPVIPVVLAGAALFGAGSGMFLAVDWALMTDIIPKASAGRYMGLSNVVEATNGPIATTVGGVIMYAVGLALGVAIGARAAMLAGVVMFALGSLLLTQVVEPRRTRPSAPGRPAEGVTPASV